MTVERLMREESQSMREKAVTISWMSVLMCSGQHMRVQELELSIQASISPLAARSETDNDLNECTSQGPLQQALTSGQKVVHSTHATECTNRRAEARGGDAGACEVHSVRCARERIVCYGFLPPSRALSHGSTVNCGDMSCTIVVYSRHQGVPCFALLCFYSGSGPATSTRQYLRRLRDSYVRTRGRAAGSLKS